jgi:hypothetical protein
MATLAPYQSLTIIKERERKLRDHFRESKEKILLTL